MPKEEVKNEEGKFFKQPMTLQVAVVGNQYDTIIETQRKPDIVDQGGIKFWFNTDDHGNLYHIRLDAIRAVISWKRSFFESLTKRVEEEKSSLNYKKYQNVEEDREW